MSYILWLYVHLLNYCIVIDRTTPDRNEYNIHEHNSEGLKDSQ